MDDYDAEMEALVMKTADIQQKRQDTRVEREGEVQMHAIFKSYSVYDTGLRKNVEQSTPPEKKFNKTKDGTKQYRAQLTTEDQVISLTTVPGQCERLPNGEDGWRILTKVSYNDKEGENAKQWLLDHYDAFYNGTYPGKFPIGEYVDEEGTLADFKWCKVYPKSITKVKVNDSDEVIFRKRVNGKDSGPFVVGPFTPLTFYKCSATHFVTLRKETEDGSTFIPQGFTSFSAKAVQIAENHDATLPITERLHMLENKDAHNMIPVEQLRQGGAVPHSVYFWAARYKSNIPCEKGVHVFKLPVDKLEDYMSTFKEETKPTHTIRLTVFQWKGDPATNREMYSVKILTRDGELWKNYGITDMNHYARILCATHNIPVHVTADLWKQNVISSEANNPETLNNKEELKHMRGVYIYGAKSIVPDYIHFYNTGQAHRISKDRVMREFKRFTSKNDETGETEITLKPTADNKQNPLNGENPTLSAVFALGNGQVDDPTAKRAKPLYHAYDGDLCEVVDNSAFFVLTSHSMNTDELALVQEESRGDTLLDEWIEKEKVYYWILGIQKKYVRTQKNTTSSASASTNATTTKTEKKEIEKKKRSVKEQDEEEDDNVELEKEEDAPPPPSASTSSKKGKTTTKKK